MIDYSVKRAHDGAIGVLNSWQKAALRLVDVSGKDVLDIGCGSGSFLYFIQPKARSVFGIDPNPHNISILEAHSIPGAGGYAKDYGQELLERFDVVACFEVIEHLYDPWEVLSSAHSALRSGGQFVVSTPNAFHLLRGLDFLFRQKHRDVLMDPTRIDIPEHIRLWSFAMIIRAFVKAGFTAVRCFGSLQLGGRVIVLKNPWLVRLFAQNLICIGVK